MLNDTVIADAIEGMLTGNTETFITVTFQTDDNTIDFVVPVLDEDDMSSNSAVHLATQQSIKAYVDSHAGAPNLDGGQADTFYSVDAIDCGGA